MLQVLAPAMIQTIKSIAELSDAPLPCCLHLLLLEATFCQQICLFSLLLYLELFAVTAFQEGPCIIRVNTETPDFTRAFPQDPVTMLDHWGPKP